MNKSQLLRLNKRLGVTWLYEGRGRQQVTVPGPPSGRIQRWKEISEANREERNRKTTNRQTRTKTTNVGKKGKHVKQEMVNWMETLLLIFQDWFDICNK